MELYLFDKNKEVISIISNEDLTNYYQRQELNGLITADIEGVYTKEIKEARYIGSQDVDDRSVFWRYKIDRLNTMGNSFFLKSTYELFDDLKGRKIIKDRRPDRWNVAQALAVILQDTGWEVGDVKSTNLASSSWFYLTPLEAFWDFLDKWRVEFKPRMVFSKGKVVAKYIDVADRLSDDYGKWYEYGDKLLTVVAEEESEHIATAFYGRGKGEESGDGWGRKISFADIEWKTSKGDPLNKPKGEEWLEFPQATAEYGYEDGTPRYKVVEFSDVEEPDELLEATYEYGLNEIRPKSHFRTNVLETELAELGETVAIIRDMDDIRYKTRIFELTRDFLNKNIKQIEFGDKLIQSRAEQSKEADNKIIEQEKQTIDWLNAIRDSIADSYFNDDGFNYELKIGNEYDLPAGYYSFDAPIDENPTKVVYMGAGKLLIANSKKPNGEWDWTTAATGDGFVADVVNTGTLNANLIKAGILMDRNGRFYLDMNTGQLIMKDGSFEGKVEADVGHVGGWTMERGGLYTNTPYGYTTLKPGGNVAIGIASPEHGSTTGAKLQIWHDGTLRFGELGTRIYSTIQNNLRVMSHGRIVLMANATVESDSRIIPMTNGDLDLGSTDRRWQRVRAKFSEDVSSDARHKRNIQEIPQELLHIIAEEVKPKEYEMDGMLHYGYVAQDVERALFKYSYSQTQSLEKANKLMKRFDFLIKDESYLSLVYTEIAVIKEAEMQARIDKLEERLDKLEKRSK